jgi:hypothetical protein
VVAYIAVSNAHLTGDEYAWLLLAREWIHHDAELYVSIVDNKGPILILLYGIITLFDGHEVLITTLLGGGCISVAAWCITKLRRSTSAADLLSIFIILGSPTLYGGTLPNSELLSGVLILLATITYYKRERTLWLSLWLLLLATFTNPKSLYFMVPLAALLLLDLRKTGIHLIADRFSFPAFLVIFGCTLVLFPVFANYVEFMISLPKGDYYSRLPVLNSGCHESFFSCINTERKDLLKLFFKNPVIIFCLLSLLYALYKRPSTTFYALLTFCIGYILFLVYVGRASGQYLIWLVLLGVIVIRQRYLLWVSAVLVLLQFAPYNGANNSSLLPEGLDSDARWFYFGRGESARFHYVEDLRPCVADYANWFVYPLFFLDTEKNINLENNTYLDHYKEQINQCDPDMIVVSDAYYHTAEPIWLSDLLSTYQLKQQYSEQRIYERKNEP